MSSIAIGHGFGTTRTPDSIRSVRRPVRSTGRAHYQAGGQAGVQAPAQPEVRLTRRGRVVLLGLFVGVVLAVLTVFGSQSAATGEPGVPVPTRTVEVAEGQTLWGIAAEVAEPGKVREMVHQIQELNAMSGSGVAVGQAIAVPLG